MSRHRHSLVILSILAAASWLAAQTKPEPSGEGQKSDVLHLSPFLVSGSNDGTSRYDYLESTSAGRIRTDIMDSAASVSVITAEVMEDVAGSRIVDAARYAAGITDSSLPTGWDRTNLRGFLADGRTVDGFTTGNTISLYGVMNLDPAVVDRIEVVKGPSSILAPQPTSPGGTINNLTKRPQFRDSSLINLQWGRYKGTSGFVDLNRAAGERLALRFVGSVRRWNEYWQEAYVHTTTLMPGLTYRFSESAELTLQYLFSDSKATNYFGLPVDPTSGTTTQARLLDGVPRNLNVYPDDTVRTDEQHDLKLLFTAHLWRGIQMRLAAVYHRTDAYLPQLNIGPSTGGMGGNYDPLTGQWNHGVRYLQTPPYSSVPLTPLPTRIFSRSGIAGVYDAYEWQIQNDYAYVHERSSWKSISQLGFVHGEAPGYDTLVYNIFAPDFDIDHYVNTPSSLGTLSSHNHSRNRFRQIYVAETLALFRNRVILKVSRSWQDYDRLNQSLLTGASARNNPTTSLPGYGIVLKPHPEAVSLYYSYTEQSSAINPSTTNQLPPLSSSRQNEFGVRLRLASNKLYLSIARYDIIQDNFSVPNPGNFTSPRPNPPLPPLYLDRTARGWEYELRAHPTKNLSLIGSYTHFKNRDPNNVELRSVAEKAGGVLVSYTFAREPTSALAGLRVALGVDYLARRPGDTPSSVFTNASTPDHPIPHQPSFYLPARTLLNLTLAYKFGDPWSVQLNVENLLNQEYLMAANIRNGVMPGSPTNVRISVRRNF